MANWLRDFLAANPESAKLPVHKRDRYSIQFQRPDGAIEAHFTGVPIHYQDEQGEWQPLDTALRDMGNGELGAPGLKVRLTRDGVSRIEGSKYSQVTRGVGLLPETHLESLGGFKSVASIPPARTVQDDCLVTEGDFWRHELRLTETGLRETLVLTDPPADLSESGWVALETVVTGVDLADGWVSEWEVDGNRFHLPRAWDANSEELPCKRYARKVDGAQCVYTVVPVDALASATYPVTIDPDFADTTGDAELQGKGPNYGTARYTCNQINNEDYNRCGMRQGSSYCNVYRPFLRFNTTSLPASGITVQSVSMVLTAIGDNSEADYQVQIVKANWGAYDPLTTANMDAAYDLALSQPLDSSVWRSTAGMPLNTPYRSGALDKNWPRGGGITYYALISSRDRAGIAPVQGTDEYINIAAAEYSTAAYRPYLTVTYVYNRTGSGAVKVPKATVAASGRQEFRASGASTLPKATLAAEGMYIPFHASGDWSPERVTLASEGLLQFKGSGAISLPKLVFTGAGSWDMILGRPRISVEIAFASDPPLTPIWTDVSGYVREVHIRRGRQHERGRIEAGTATLILDNRDRRFDPTYELGPHYGQILPMRRVRIKAIWRHAEYPLFAGFIEAWPQIWGPGLDSTCEVNAVDGFKVLRLMKLRELAVPQELSGKRVQRVLDATGMSGVFVDQGYWVLGDPAASALGVSTKIAGEIVAFRFINPGASEMQADVIDTYALDYLQCVTDSEDGLLFMDREGRLTFQDRHYRVTKQINPVGTFGDAPDETEWPYADLTLNYDDTWIYNEIQVSRRDGEKQIAGDPDSQRRYFARTLELDDLLLTSDIEAMSCAQDLLNRYREPGVRVESIILQPTGYDDMWPVVLDRELSDRITVVRRPRGDAAIVRDYYLEAVTHDITDSDWDIRWQLSPAPIDTVWMLGVSELGVNTRLAR